VDLLIGVPGKAKQKLGWTPTVDFPGLVKMMVDADLARLAKSPEPARAAR
jgi:GDPmannose 4,6-dehydratase